MDPLIQNKVNKLLSIVEIFLGIVFIKTVLIQESSNKKNQMKIIFQILKKLNKNIKIKIKMKLMIKIVMKII